MKTSPRIVRRKPSPSPGFSWRSLRPAELLDVFRNYFGLGGAARLRAIDSPEALAEFLDTRASYIAQSMLYGYLRTRMGMRYPELFQDDDFVVGINIAKWEIWLDCLSDLSVHAGARIAQKVPDHAPRVGDMMIALVDEILLRTGTPPDAGAHFPDHSSAVRERITRTYWLAIGEYEAAFTESPASVLRWAPVDDAMKALDEEIVRNSVRFHWHEVRRDFTRYVDPHSILGIGAGGDMAS